MLTHEQITKALVSLSNSAQWTMRGGDYENIEWLCECPKPTFEEIEVESVRLESIEAQAKADQATAKQAILDRLGLTADEAKLLLS